MTMTMTMTIYFRKKTFYRYIYITNLKTNKKRERQKIL